LNDLIFYSLGTVLPIFIFNLLFNFKFLKQWTQKSNILHQD
jgi:hypothetical protein